MANLIIKVSFVVGAGIVGSIIAKDGGVSDLVSGAAKIIFKQLKNSDSPASVKKPPSEALLAQVNSLRQELQILASNRAVTIVTGGGTGTQKFGIIVIVGVVGYGYIWWKGYKLPDMMFATRRGLSDACNVVAKQLDGVNSMVVVTRKALNNKINGLDENLKNIGEITTATQNEVSQLHDVSNAINDNVQYVRSAVKTLESKISSLESKQDKVFDKVGQLYILGQEHLLPANRIETLASISPRLALEAPHPSRSASLPVPALAPPPDDFNGIPKVQQSPRHIASVTGLKELGEPASTPKALESKSSGSSGLLSFFSGGGVSFRTRNATNAVRSSNGGHQQDLP